MNENTQYIVCGFPGIGKSYLVSEMRKANCLWHDSDSSSFSWVSPGVRHPEFPSNYIKHIKALDGIVMASSHKVVRDAIHVEGLSFAVCYPDISCKEEYLERYRVRGSPAAFVSLLENNWDTWIAEMVAENRAEHH